MDYLRLPFLISFSDSLPPFFYEGKHDSPSLLAGCGDYRNRSGCRRLSVVAVALVRRFDPVFTKQRGYPWVKVPQLVDRLRSPFHSPFFAPLRVRFLAGFSDSLPPFVYEGKHDSPSFLRGDQNRNRGYRKRRQRRPD